MIELKTWRETATVMTTTNCSGSLTEILEELSIGAAHMLVDLVDGMRVADKHYDGMAQAFGDMVADAVGRVLLAREGESEEHEQQEPESPAED